MLTIGLFFFILLSVFPAKMFSQKRGSGDDLNINLIDLDDNIPGKAGIDYPVYNTVPKTNFKCERYEYAGYFGDPETRCQAFHVCFPDGRNASFLCVNGTVFHQRYFVCDWWFHFDCSQAPKYYEQNKFRRPPLPVLPPSPRKPLSKPIPEPKKVIPPKPRQPVNRNIDKRGNKKVVPPKPRRPVNKNIDRRGNKKTDPKSKPNSCYCPCR